MKINKKGVNLPIPVFLNIQSRIVEIPFYTASQNANVYQGLYCAEQICITIKLEERRFKFIFIISELFKVVNLYFVDSFNIFNCFFFSMAVFYDYVKPSLNFSSL